jgi:probable F420-dependent oxidoreductase
VSDTVDRVGPRFGICVPQFAGAGGFDPGAVRAYLERVEELGFDSVWTAEQVLGTAPLLGALETMAFAAACTRRVRIGCAVLISTVHSPVHLAKSIASLDQLSGGRIEVGLGSGGGFRPFEAYGISRDGFIARFVEGLALMRACWADGRVRFDGRFWQVRDAGMEPKPVQRPGPPVWLGGGHPAAVRRAARLADGFFGAGSSTTAKFAEQVAVLRRELAEVGRDAAGFGVAKRVYVAVDHDPARAKAAVLAGLDRVYGEFGIPGIEAVGVRGTPDDVVRQLREVVDAGAELVMLHPLSDEAGQLEMLHAEVLPRVVAAS